MLHCQWWVTNVQYQSNSQDVDLSKIGPKRASVAGERLVNHWVLRHHRSKQNVEVNQYPRWAAKESVRTIAQIRRPLPRASRSASEKKLQAASADKELGRKEEEEEEEEGKK